MVTAGKIGTFNLTSGLCVFVTILIFLPGHISLELKISQHRLEHMFAFYHTDATQTIHRKSFCVGWMGCSYSVAVIVCVTVTEATARLQAAATMWICNVD